MSLFDRVVSDDEYLGEAEGVSTALFDSLKSGESILVAMKSIMGTSRLLDGSYHEWKVGRRAQSKTYGVTTLTLLPTTGKQVGRGAMNRFALRKRGDKVTASHGDMGLVLIGVKRPS